MDVIRRFSPEAYGRALESWAWVDLFGKEPRFTSPFGDVFLEGTDGWWFLDTLEGTLTRRWDTAEACHAELNTIEGQEQFLLVGLAEAADAAGVVPGEDEVYSFTRPPVLGGEMEPANIELLDFIVSVNLLGQIHEQVKDLPPGAHVAEIHLHD
jgi:hypothetical protein